LQGDVAIDSIIQALRKIKKIQHHFDAVLIIRGGGGEVGLSCYNNFQLCEAIATFPLPVLTGIGHSTNLTVAEMIAYRHAITPTKLAEFILENYQRFDHDLLKLSLAIGNQSSYLLQDNNHRFALLTKALQQIALQQNNRSKHELSFMIKNLGHLSKESINNQKYLTLNFKSSMKQSVFTFISKAKLELSQQEGKTNLTFQQNLNQQKSTLDTLVSIVKALDPAQVLKRGYSITYFNGKSIQEGQKLKKGDKITSLGSAFTLEATIENFQVNENNKDSDKNQATS
jgi:exodeoxyribonuclease VII large subunit